MHSSDSEFIVREDNAVYETDTPVLYSVAEGIATLTLNRPSFNNAQNSQMTYALDAAASASATRWSNLAIASEWS